MMARTSPSSSSVRPVRFFVIAAGMLRTHGVPERVQPVYAWLAAKPGEPVVAELPLQGCEDVVTRLAFHESIYLLYSTLHWSPLVNGYAVIEPQPYLELRAAGTCASSSSTARVTAPPSGRASSATSCCSPASCARKSASTATPCTR